uniref:Large ribosomal subunit protein uL24c n=1 Tax=Ishige okamurae TaxID=233772 RepID=A0A8E5XRS0_9PHAE|nr:ribosomal protein L24 [Ishige okamurae]QVJ99693.1 ribosomal protein L24 [Ishige okamurae]WAM63989.1 50S ribosomal protein L24 [Ishige okamurae]
MKKESKNLTQKPSIKVGKEVKIISGKEKGKVGRVEKILRKTNQILIQGINIKTKNIKPKVKEEKGEVQRKEFPIHISNVSCCKE